MEHSEWVAAVQPRSSEGLNKGSEDGEREVTDSLEHGDGWEREAQEDGDITDNKKFLLWIPKQQSLQCHIPLGVKQVQCICKEGGGQDRGKHQSPETACKEGSHSSFQPVATIAEPRPRLSVSSHFQNNSEILISLQKSLHLKSK